MRRDPPPGREPGLEDDEALLERFARTRDPAIRELLVDRNLPLASALAARYRNRGETDEDLEQVAFLGLVNAIDRFDPDHGVRFRSFATPTILGELRRHFRDHRWAMHVPRDLKEAMPRINEAVESLSVELGRPPSTEEIAAHAELGTEEVLDALAAYTASRPASLEQPSWAGEDDGAPPLREQVGSDDSGFDRAEERATIEPRLQRLSRRDREVLRLRFEQDMTQSQIAERVGVSQMQVSRILRASLIRLREPG